MCTCRPAAADADAYAGLFPPKVGDSTASVQYGAIVARYNITRAG